MKAHDFAVLRFILGALGLAAGYLLLGNVLFPNDHSAGGEIVKALVWGIVVQVAYTGQSRRLREGKSPFPPEMVILASGIGFGFSIWCFTQPKSEAEWFLPYLYAVVAVISLWVLVRAVNEVRRGSPGPTQ